MQLPKEIEEITPEWLTAALREGGTLTQGSVKSVSAERIAVGVGMMGRLARLSVEYEGAGDDAPTSMIFKYPIDLPQNREVADAYRFYKRECDFYSKIAPQSPLRTPALYFQECREDLNFVLLLEDLGAARAGDQVAGNRPEDAKHAILELAKHHARFWGKTDDMDFLVDIDDPVVCHVLDQTCKQAGPVMLDTYAEMFTPELVELTHGVIDRTTAALKSAKGKQLTVGHGDFRADNLFFEGMPDGGTLAVIDWQICNRGHGAFDVAYHLTQSISSEDRRAIERPVLEAYHQTLVEGGVKDYGFDELWEDYREAALFALVYPITVCGAFDLSDPRANALARIFLERSLHAITDLKAGEKLALWD